MTLVTFQASEQLGVLRSDVQHCELGGFYLPERHVVKLCRSSQQCVLLLPRGQDRYKQISFVTKKNAMLILFFS